MENAKNEFEFQSECQALLCSEDPKEALLGYIAQLLAEDPERIVAQQGNLSLLGIDSMGAAGISSFLKSRFGRIVSSTSILSMDLNGLALCAKTGHQESFGQEGLLRRMEEDAQISETLQDRIRAQPACASLDTIFVTGGTGTLGAAMIGLLLVAALAVVYFLSRRSSRGYRHVATPLQAGHDSD